MSLRFLPLLMLVPALAFAGGHADDPSDGHADAHAGARAGAEAGHPAHAGQAPAADAPLPAGAPWPADEPLSRGMARVRAATTALDHAAHGHLDPVQVKGIAAELRSAVQMMFAECRLEPAPDAALHPLLASVLDAAGVLEQGFDPRALASLQAVVGRYPVLFVDAAWSESQSD